MWLYVPTPSTSFPSAPVAAGSISASSWQFLALARSAWWRGRPSPSRIWWRRWNKVSWLRALSGRMPEPSTAALGVASWISSLAESRASRTASPASGAAPTTSGTCGPSPGASSCSRARGPSSSRTCPVCSARPTGSGRAPKGFGETYSDWVSRLRADSSARRTSARRTSASDCSSWPSPSAGLHNDGEEPETFLARREALKGAGINGNGAGTPLAIAAKQWPTPTSVNHRSVEASDETHARNARPLQEFVGRWPTPATTDSNGARNRTSGRSNPASRHHDGVTLNDAILLYSLPDRPISTDGEESSHIRRTLNPLFVEWLMGWPPGWTSLGLTPPASSVCACSATALSRWRRDMRFALSQLASADAPPAQLSFAI